MDNDSGESGERKESYFNGIHVKLGEIGKFGCWTWNFGKPIYFVISGAQIRLVLCKDIEIKVVCPE